MIKKGNTWSEIFTQDERQVELRFQKVHFLSQSGHIRILPPTLASHISLLKWEEITGKHSRVVIFFKYDLKNVYIHTMTMEQTEAAIYKCFFGGEWNAVKTVNYSALWCPLVAQTLICCHHNWELHKWNIWGPWPLQRRASLCRSPAKQNRSQSFPHNTSCNKREIQNMELSYFTTCDKWQTVACLPDEVQRLLFVKAEKSGPVLVQVVALALTFGISRLFPVSALKANILGMT